MLNHCAGCSVPLIDNIEIGKSYPCILIRSRCSHGCAVYREKKLVICYDDEWFAEEMGLLSCRRHAPKPFCDASTSRTVSVCGV